MLLLFNPTDVYEFMFTGNHKCPAPCHVGQCLPCPITLPVNCACGQTDYLINCGAERRAPPPKCKALCPLPTLCRHEALLMKFQGPLPLLSVKVSELKRMEHKCHFGACPKNACSNVRDSLQKHLPSSERCSHSTL